MTEYKGKNQKDLIKELSSLKTKLNEFRFAVAGSKAKNVREGRGLRRDIARIMTELSATHVPTVVVSKAVVKARSKTYKRGKK